MKAPLPTASLEQGDGTARFLPGPGELPTAAAAPDLLRPRWTA